MLLRLLYSNALVAILLLFCTFMLEGCSGSSDVDINKLHGSALGNLLDSLQKVESSKRGQMCHIPKIYTTKVKPGQGLYQVLGQLNLDNRSIIRIVSAISDSVELVKIHAGETFEVGLDPIDSTKVLAFRYAPNPALAHILTLDTGGNFVYTKVEKPTTLRNRLYQGSLEKGSNLDGTLRKIGIDRRMVQVVNGILMCKVAFNLAHPGDKFRVMIQERVFQDSIWIEGTVLYASFDGKNLGYHEAFDYDDGDPKSTFNAHYTPLGEALVFSGLRYPLDRLHISCAFGMRLHPITGLREMHWGVDYSTPLGTPVFAVADGVVVQSGFDPFSGNKIAIRHMDNSTSWYLHLSMRGVGVGQHVRARQIIAQSGNTGRSTGPHLHFGFKQANGAWINPLTKRMIATPKLEGGRLEKLQKQIIDIRKQLSLLLKK